jgi:hypothetical protein
MHPELDLLIRFIDGEGDLRECRGVRLHLANCQECRLEAAYLLRAVRHSRTGAPRTAETLARIRRWESERWQDVRGGGAVKSRVASEISPFLGRDASGRILMRVSDQDEDLLCTIESVLTAFLGRAAAPRLVSHVVDRAIMRI